MKSRILMLVTVMTLFVALAIPVALAAQKHHAKNHNYRLLDLGTFGGPTGYLCNDPTGGGGACPVLNSRGTVVSAADTSIPDPNYPNGNGFFPTDPFVFHAFQWQDGTLLDLGALPNGYNSFAYSINENGLIAGASENGNIDPLLGVPELNAVLWKDGNINNLGTLEGAYESAALAVNSHSQVAGAALNTIPDPFFGFQFRAVLWRKGSIQDLGTLGTGTDAFAYFINERGQIAGASYTNTTVNPLTGIPTQDPFLWENGTMTDLGTLGGADGFPNALNTRGQVVGVSDLTGDIYAHAFLWPGKDGKMQDLGTLDGASPPSSEARWINDAGDIVGGSYTATAFHAVLWKNGAITDLGTVGGDKCSGSLGVNSETQVVGFSSVDCAVNSHAFLWEDGQLIDLNIFNYQGSGLEQLLLAYNINDSGEIDGLGVPPGVDPKDVFTLGHVFALIPCDEKHRDDEGCHEGNTTNEVPLPRPTLREPARPVPSRTLPKWSSRYRGFSSTGSDRVANDPPGGATPLFGYCGVNINGTLTGECIGTLNNQCSSQYDKRQCPPGKKAIAPTDVACGVKELAKVDAARSCAVSVCSGRCGFGCGRGCACGKDGNCHRLDKDALKELLWDPQQESALRTHE
jgi:probable HAF family extracellular repeat protein